VQQLRETFPEAGPYRYIIFDHDSKFNGHVIRLLTATGLTTKADQHPGILAERNCGTMGWKLPSRDVGPNDTAK